MNYSSSDFVDKMLISNPNRYCDKWTVDRNKEILNFVKDIKFNNIFEFAGGTGTLAKMFLISHAEIESYIFSDFSPIACKLAKEYLKEFDNIRVNLYDMTKDLDNILWKNFDLIVCTSMEHFPKDLDLKILKHVQKGTYILFGMSTFRECTHQHVYPNIEYVIVRFKDIIDIENISYSNKKRQILLYGKSI